MECKNLINLIDDFNDHNVIASLNLKPNQIVFIYENNKEDYEEFKIIRDYLEEKLPRTEIVGVPIKDAKPEYIEEIISSYDKDDTIINLSGGNKLLSLLTFQIAQKYNVKSIFVDVDEEAIINLNHSSAEELDIELMDLDVKDFVASTGGEILCEASHLFDNPQVQKLIDYIVENYGIWEELKNILKNFSAIQHDKLSMYTVVINLNSIDSLYKEEFKEFINRIVQLELAIIKYSSRQKIVLQFKNMDYKGLIFKIGTWLEVLAYKLVKELKEVDDVKSGVLFLWDEDVRYVKNEVDVVASANSKLVYISCKDTGNYDVETLNEIEVYSQQLGGEGAKKILVATKESFKSSTILRAEEMDIDILVFNGDTEKLKNELKKVIMD